MAHFNQNAPYSKLVLLFTDFTPIKMLGRKKEKNKTPWHRARSRPKTTRSLTNAHYSYY